MMDLLTPEIADALRTNAAARADAYRARRREPDPAPVVKLFSPVSAATWLATELGGDGDTLFGLADLGLGCPELGSFSLREIAALRLPLALIIERDRSFSSLIPLSLWADAARIAGSIVRAERVLADTDRRLRAALDLLDPHQLPSRKGGG